MFTKENPNRTFNLLVTSVLLVILVAGGIYFVRNTDFGSDAIPVIENEPVCIEAVGDIFKSVCTNSETNAVLVALGNSPREAVEVTIVYDGLTVTGMSDVIIETYVADEIVTNPTDEPEVSVSSTLSLSTSEPTAVVASVNPEFAYVSVRGVPSFIRLSDHFPTRSYPVRWGNGIVQPNENPFNAMASVVAEPGVISADAAGDCDGNPSCVWSGATLEHVDSGESYITCPAGGYVKITGPSYIVEGIVSIEAQPMTNHTTLLRCNYDATGDDDNNVLHIMTTHPWAVQYITYPVPASAGGFFSFEHLIEDLVNGQTDGNNNCGSQGCDYSYLEIFDVNHDMAQVWSFTGESDTDYELNLLASNAVQPE